MFAPLVLSVVLAQAPHAVELMGADLAADKCDFALALLRLDALKGPAREEPYAMLFRARVLVQLERFDEAIAVLDALKVWRDIPDVRLLRGLAEGGRKHLEKALHELDLAEQGGADRVVVLGAKAVAWLRAGNLEEGERLLRAALKEDPLLSGALYNLAVVRVRQGRLAEAGALIRQAWFAGYHNAHALKTDPDLAPLLRVKGLIDDLANAPESTCDTY